MAFSPTPGTPPTTTAAGPTPAAPSGRNWLALASLLLALPYAMFIVVSQIPDQTLPSLVQQALGVVGTVLCAVGLPTMIAAIVTGHLALSQAKRFSPARAWRRLAIAGLALGYLSVLYVIWLLVQFALYLLSGKPILE
jgi:hypothetical protein